MGAILMRKTHNFNENYKFPKYVQLVNSIRKQIDAEIWTSKF